MNDGSKRSLVHRQSRQSPLLLADVSAAMRRSAHIPSANDDDDAVDDDRKLPTSYSTRSLPGRRVSAAAVAVRWGDANDARLRCFRCCFVACARTSNRPSRLLVFPPRLAPFRTPPFSSVDTLAAGYLNSIVPPPNLRPLLLSPSRRR